MESRKRFARPAGLASLGALAVLLLALVIGGGRSFGAVLAQDATPAAEATQEGHPGHIHAGSCGEDELGDVVEALNNATEPEGEEVGQTDLAATVATSFTSVPLTLDDILADDHAINLHLSAEEIETYIACGEIGGSLSAEDGSLTVGLREVDGSGFVGVAYLAPGADGESTDVSVFIAEGLTGTADGVGGGDADEDEDATPTT